MSGMNRRTFLRGLGGMTLSLPYLPSLIVGGKANAAVTVPKRFVAICNYDGYYESVYYPTINADKAFANDVYYKPFSEFSTPVSEVFDSRFNVLKNKMNIYRGLDIPGSMGHSSANMLCGAARKIFGDTNPVEPVGTSRSIDVIMSNSKLFYPATPAFAALRGQEPPYNYGMSFDKDANNNTLRLPYDKYPNDIFQRVFGKSITDPTVAQKFKSKKLLIGDLVLNDFLSLKNSKRISSEDKLTLDSFVDRLQRLNQRINDMPTVLSCSPPVQRPISTHYWDLMTTQDIKNFYSNYIDVMVSAMACDLTRISVITMRLWGHDHTLSHADPSDRNNQLQYLNNTKKITDILLEFATKMDAIKEANGLSMLDNSLLFWGNEDSNGSPHSCISMPAATFGSASGAIKTGYYVDYRQRPFFHHPDGQNIGRSYSQLLITMMRALGLQESDYINYGDGKGFGSFNPYASYTENRYVPYESQRNSLLPFIGVA